MRIVHDVIADMQASASAHRYATKGVWKGRGRKHHFVENTPRNPDFQVELFACTAPIKDARLAAIIGEEAIEIEGNSRHIEKLLRDWLVLLEDAKVAAIEQE